MTYSELKNELKRECYFAPEVNLWLSFRKEELQKLPFSEYKDIIETAALMIECDNCCA